MFPQEGITPPTAGPDMPKPPIRFTQERVRNLTPPATGRDEIRDAEQNGLYLRITDQGIRTWRVIKRNPKTGKLERATLGRWPDISVAQARFMAQEIVFEILKGNSPATTKRRQKIQALTLSQVLEDFLKKPGLTDRTCRLYRAAIHNHLGDWLSLPLDRIKEPAIKERHQAIGQTNPGAANFCMTVFTAIWNHARAAERVDGQPALPESPTAILTRQKLRFPGVIKQNHLPRAYFRDWYAAAQALPNPALRDYLLTLILTGLRRDEARLLRWDQIDLKARTFTLPDPKNHRPHSLPLTDYLYALLIQRKKAAKKSEWVFPSQANGPFPEKTIYAAERAVSDSISYEFRSHCLRKTFATEAEQLGVGSHVVSKLLNHSPKRGDITARYVILNVETLRTPLETITRHFLTEFGVLDAPADAPPAR